ncbi:MAG: beta-ketoacyl-ACP synthase II [bacterium]
MELEVVVTGLGVISPLGNTVEEFWEALCTGRSGITRITRFDASSHRSQVAGEVKNFTIEEFLSKKESKNLELFHQYALAASIMAIRNSGLTICEENRDRIGVLIGAGMGGMECIERNHDKLVNFGPKKVSPFLIPMSIINMASGIVSKYFEVRGPNSAIVTACATGTHAIGDAFKIIQRGDAQAIIAGGTESVVSPLAFAGFSSMKALTTRNDEPERASRPFEKNRDGFVLGEGCGIVILEEKEAAKKRGAPIYAEIVGYGMSSDAYHISTPDPSGTGAMLCIKRAIESARINPEQITVVNAHGTSTKFNDTTETLALKRIFNEHAHTLMVSANKSMTGHLLGATGGVEVVASCLTLKEGIIPPTINYEEPDPECDLDYVPNTAREQKVNYILKNSFGFGGTNTSLVLKKCD